jgi:hypothetical protein
MREGVLDALGHLLPEREPVPRALVEELLQVLFVAVGQPYRHRAGALALAIEQETAQVHTAPVLSIFAP